LSAPDHLPASTCAVENRLISLPHKKSRFALLMGNPGRRLHGAHRLALTLDEKL